MPAKTDLFAACKELATRAEIVTVWRGLFFPVEVNLPPASYPAMGYRDDAEGIESGSGGGGHILTGYLDLDFWIHTGHDGIPAMAAHPEDIDVLDELHDKILDVLRRADRTEEDAPESLLTSQNISLTPDETRGWTHWWGYIDSPHAGATLRLRYRMGN